MEYPEVARGRATQDSAEHVGRTEGFRGVHEDEADGNQLPAEED
jgi:hypothetical protein